MILNYGLHPSRDNKGYIKICVYIYSAKLLGCCNTAAKFYICMVERNGVAYMKSPEILYDKKMDSVEWYSFYADYYNGTYKYFFPQIMTKFLLHSQTQDFFLWNARGTLSTPLGNSGMPWLHFFFYGRTCLHSNSFMYYRNGFIFMQKFNTTVSFSEFSQHNYELIFCISIRSIRIRIFCIFPSIKHLWIVI